MFMVFDPLYLAMLLPTVIIAMWAQAKVHSTFAKYSKIRTRSGISGAAMARDILNRNGCSRVTIEPIAGNLTDHYDPRTGTLRLSQGVYNSTSMAAVGIAAHEAGHAIQQRRGYWPMHIRQGLVPIMMLGPGAAMVMFVLGMFFRSPMFMQIAIVLFAAIVLFNVVTLPVEFNASRRALQLMRTSGYVTEEEVAGARKVLTAAALTYVAATLTAIMWLLYAVMRSRR